MISENILNIKVVYGFNSNEGVGKQVFIVPIIFTYQQGTKSLRAAVCVRSVAILYLCDT